MNGRIAVALMSVLLVLYLGLVVLLSFRLLAVGEPIATAMGVALIVLPLLGFWALVTELLFGVRSQTLGAELRSEGLLLSDELPRTPSGRPVRDAAAEVFSTTKAEVEADPGSWRAWYRLGLAYDASGDRRRARSSIRRSIALHREERLRAAHVE